MAEPGGLVTGEPGMKSAANGRESRDRFQDVALKPVAYETYAFTLSVTSYAKRIV